MDDEVMVLCEAIKVWQPDIDEVDAVCAAEAYFVESRFTEASPWQLLALDILEIDHRQPPLAARSAVTDTVARDAKVISMDRWRKENGR